MVWGGGAQDTPSPSNIEKWFPLGLGLVVVDEPSELSCTKCMCTCEGACKLHVQHN